MLRRIAVVAVAVTLGAVSCDARDEAADPAREAPAEATRGAADPEPDATALPQATDSRFIVELGPGQTVEDLEAAAERYFQSVSEIRPLFEDLEAEELGPVYVVHVREVEPLNPWDAARAFQDAGGFARVEPDLERTLEPEARRARAAGSCFWDDGVPAPDDRGWSLARMRVSEAWALPLPTGGKRFGEGVRVCHPDTGWTSHDELADALDLTRDRDLLDRDDEAEDPLHSGALLNPGHGTATGSVIASRGGLDGSTTTPPGEVTGVAPGAELVEIRTVESVVQAFDSDVARAVAYATNAGCDVVSMSLGGRLFFGLERAVRRAVEREMIVVAAAGNCVDFVVAPAVYDDVIAVAATNADDAPWRGSSHGRAIAIAAPGEDVWSARATGGALPSNGTSFATAETAGAAALWLAYHGRAGIDAARGDARTQDLFVHLLGRSAATPPGWDASEYGPGILDAEALLKEDLMQTIPRRAVAPPSELEKLARLTDRDPARLRAQLDAAFETDDVEAALERFAPELSELALRDPEAFEAFLESAGGPRRPGAERVARDASLGLRAALSEDQ